MDTKEFIQSKTFLGIVAGIFTLAILTGVFQVGQMVGFRRASFSYNWSEQYDRNFGGPQRGIFGMMGSPRFVGAHGIFGTILKNEGDSLIITGANKIEQVVKLNGQTLIRRGSETIKVSDLAISEGIIVVGEPNNQGEILAKLIRSMSGTND